jgi:hypothetical protein
MAQCASGNVANTNLLSDSACQAAAAGSGTAVGFNARATGSSSAAFGWNALATGSLSTAVGRFSGTPTAVAGQTSVGFSAGSNGGGVYSTSIGAGTSSGPASVTALGNYAVAVGGGDGSTFAPPVGSAAITLNGAQAAGVASTAVGPASQAGGNGASAYGLNSQAVGNDSSAFGESSIASGASSTALGALSAATGTYSLAFGRASGAGGAHANANTTALGVGAKAGTGASGQSDATAVGASALANANRASALGYASNASGGQSLALGVGASATSAQGVAIGYNSVAKVANTVSVGRAGHERRIVNVATATHATDAVNLGQVEALIKAAKPAGADVAGAIPGGSAKAEPRRHGSSLTQTASLSPHAGGASQAANDAGPASVQKAAAASGEMACELGGTKLAMATAEHGTGSANFSSVAQSSVSFQQSGARGGCAALSFSAEVLAPGDTAMEVRAVLDGNVEATPGPVLFAQDTTGFQSRAFNFVFANLSPGAHRVEVQFRNAGANGTVRMGRRTTMIQYARD